MIIAIRAYGELLETEAAKEKIDTSVLKEYASVIISESDRLTHNEQLVYQVWQNLISNAIKFSNPKGTITVIFKTGEKGAYFEIADNGIGIKESDKEKIFDHFFMADTSRNSDGNGLGLSIIKKILSKIGGEIAFESKESSGSKFTVRLY